MTDIKRTGIRPRVWILLNVLYFPLGLIASGHIDLLRHAAVRVLVCTDFAVLGFFYCVLKEKTIVGLQFALIKIGAALWVDWVELAALANSIGKSTPAIQEQGYHGHLLFIVGALVVLADGIKDLVDVLARPI